jgi:hypothetical protein
MMTTITVNDELHNVLQELTVADATEVIKDYVITEILSKISDFSQEAEHFQEKYGQSFREFKTLYETGEEDFEQYDDLMAWEFAQQGKEYWEKRLEGVKNVL